MTLSLNQRAHELADRLAADAEALRVKVQTLPGGTRVIDCGSAVPGGLEAGRRFAEITMGGLGSVGFAPLVLDGLWMPGLTVVTDHPALACLGSQYAGWKLDRDGYFAMASGHGIGYHHTTEEQHHKHVPSTQHDIYRQVYWARYVDWTVTTPLLLLDLALLAGLPGANIAIAIVADIIMVLTGLFASFGSEQTAQKWGWYTIACVAYLVVVWQLVYHGRNAAAAKGGKVGNFFAAIGGFTLIIWTVYPM